MKTKTITPTFSPRFQIVTLTAGLLYCIVQIVTSLRLLLSAYPGGSGFRISQLTVFALSMSITPLVLYGLSYFLLTKKGSRLQRAFLAYIAAAIYFSIFLLCNSLFHTLITFIPVTISVFIMSSPWTLLTPLAITLMLLAISAPFVKKLLVTTTLTLAQQKTLALAIITPTALSIVPTLWAASAQYYATPTLLILLTQTLAPLVFFLVALLLNWSRAWQHTLLVAALQSSIAMIIIETFFLRNIVSNRFLPIELITSPFVQYGITLALLVILAFFLKRK